MSRADGSGEVRTVQHIDGHLALVPVHLTDLQGTTLVPEILFLLQAGNPDILRLRHLNLHKTGTRQAARSIALPAHTK